MKLLFPNGEHDPVELKLGTTRVGSGAGKSSQDTLMVEPAHFSGIVLDDGLADADLAVAADHRAGALAHHQDRRGVPERVGRRRFCLGHERFSAARLPSI